jgi:arylsulfatase A-like enzyme
MKNIVYLHTHDTGRCISPYGYALDTPNLKALAENSALFRNAFDCCPTCSPARASLLTGQYPHQCGMTGLAHRGFTLNDTSRHLASFLGRNGYETVLAGVQHEFAGEVSNLGYQRNFQFSGELPPGDVARQRMHIDSVNADQACGFLRDKHDKPFFLSLGLVSTHRIFPEIPDPQYNPDYMLPPPPIANVPECRLDWARFATMVTHVDYCFGKVIDTLKETGLDDSTLLIVTTDHGPAFPGMKCCLTDNGTGIMLIMQAPGIPGGMVTDTLTSHLDVYPTICEWASLPAPDWLEGNSLWPLFRGETQCHRKEVFAELSFHAAEELLRSVRTERYRYVRRFDSFPTTILPNIDNGDIKRFMVTHCGLAERRREDEEQLFDLYYDPAECNSVAGRSEYAGILVEMRARLTKWMEATADPLLTGAMPKPEKIMLDPQDAAEPTP